MKKTPRRRTFDESRVKLSRLESFVLSRVDGQLSVNDLVQLTGLAPPQVEQIIGKLESQGAIELSEAPSGPQLDELLADEPLPDPKEVVEEIPGELPEALSTWIADELPAGLNEVAAPAGEEPDDVVDLAPAAPPPSSPMAGRSSLPIPREPEPMPLDPDAAYAEGPQQIAFNDAGKPNSKPPPRASSKPPPPLAPGEEGDGEDPSEKQPSLVPAEGDVTDPMEFYTPEVQNYRMLYETELRQLPLHERLAKARMESGPVLFGMCFDQDPQIVKGILENDRMNLDHARLIAANHRNPVGLEAICQRVALIKDARVQRMLLRNVQLTEALMKRVLLPKRLLEIYKASIDRDIPDRTRNGAKNLFKNKFGQSAAEEKFEIIWNTEGRVLPHLLGQTIDQKTTALFCARNFTSVVLIQAFARFPATPPGILAHMLRQPLVKRQAHLRNMILQHPNVPSEAKRKA